MTLLAAKPSSSYLDFQISTVAFSILSSSLPPLFSARMSLHAGFGWSTMTARNAFAESQTYEPGGGVECSSTLHGPVVVHDLEQERQWWWWIET